MQKFADVVLDRKGNVVPGASVLVTTLGGALATIFSANGSSSIANPTSTDANGQFAFYAADGRYSVAISINGLLYATRTDILLEDPNEASAANIDGGTISNVALSNITIDGLPPATSAELAALEELAEESAAIAVAAAEAAALSASQAAEIVLGGFINDITPLADRVYSSQKTEARFSDLASDMSTNKSTIEADYTLQAGFNGSSVGPITIAPGVTVTISPSSTWSIQ